MTQGLFAATSGIRSNQLALDVISNNVANVNTLGFKGSTINFSTLFSRTFSGGNAPNGALGGTNPMELGTGALVSEITKVFSQGGSQITGRNTDLLINGEGFFVTQSQASNNGTGFNLTRAGNFNLDSEGNLTTVTGDLVKGTSIVDGRSPLSEATIKVPLEFQVAKFTDATQSVTDVSIGGLGSTAGDFATYATANSLTPTATTISTLSLVNIEIGPGGNITANYSNGDRISVRLNPDNTTNATELVYFPAEGGAFPAINVTANDQGSFGQLGGANAVFSAPGGGTPMEGMQMQMMMASVVNPSGLLADGSNNYLTGANSGEAFFGVPGSGSRGTVQAGQLESSNVDLASEFTKLVVYQRGLEAASRMIRAQSEVLQNIINAV